MNFSYSPAAQELADMTRDLACSGRPLWPALAEAGVLAAALPERAGGDGHGLPEQCAILVELGRAAAAVPYLTSILTASAVAHFGTDEQVETLAIPASRGSLILTPDLRPSPAGAAWLSPAGPASLPPAGAAWLSPAGAASLPPAGAAWLRERLTIGAAAMQLGITERALEMTADYARERVQFGRPIGSFQAVAQRLADAWIDVEALRLTLWQAVCRPETAEIATAGFWAAEVGHRVLHTAVHVHGGVGIDLEYPLHRYFLAAEKIEFQLGGATRQLLDLAEVLP
ncbi:acyl-CoA dehydrogenase family protein [Actinoplanes derwentensis]|uniref:Acyl-CoA dehydrogenase, N-terminal domain n=1 Tax=Actinoplanes derwentensis TaxID=113562 RepID=A0A1H2AZK7_9ACTN|nr:acyl-CoA dehydrogenase [Actinoplanes derwentensis]GID87208.1 hypothetical protein Ade03nite_61320 [Actinoplanes derwentensis]SDT51455.1 Acyl-CoA dehydrogenase, N-terminal domain [Actinoplanes derwentensis]